MALPAALLIAVVLASYVTEKALARRFGPGRSQIPKWVVVVGAVIIAMSARHLAELPALWEAVVVVCAASVAYLVGDLVINLKRR